MRLGAYEKKKKLKSSPLNQSLKKTMGNNAPLWRQEMIFFKLNFQTSRCKTNN